MFSGQFVQAQQKAEVEQADIWSADAERRRDTQRWEENGKRQTARKDMARTTGSEMQTKIERESERDRDCCTLLGPPGLCS